MKCWIVGCQREAQGTIEGTDICLCLTHYRACTGNVFGQKADIPWTKQQAIDALVEQDGLDPVVAAKRVDDFFEHYKPKP